jgi:hypothetical protein
MYQSADKDGIRKKDVSSVSKIIRAIETCIVYQSGLPAQFWESGGRGIAMQPGSIVKAGT